MKNIEVLVESPHGHQYIIDPISINTSQTSIEVVWWDGQYDRCVPRNKEYESAFIPHVEGYYKIIKFIVK